MPRRARGRFMPGTRPALILSRMPARLSAASRRHPSRGMKRQWYLETSETRWRKTRGGIAPVAFQLRGVLGIGARGRRAALRPGTGEAGLVDGTGRLLTGARPCTRLATGRPTGRRVRQAACTAQPESGEGDSSRRLPSTRFELRRVSAGVSCRVTDVARDQPIVGAARGSV